MIEKILIRVGTVIIAVFDCSLGVMIVCFTKIWRTI